MAARPEEPEPGSQAPAVPATGLNPPVEQPVEPQVQVNGNQPLGGLGGLGTPLPPLVVTPAETTKEDDKCLGNKQLTKANRYWERVTPGCRSEQVLAPPMADRHANPFGDMGNPAGPGQALAGPAGDRHADPFGDMGMFDKPPEFKTKRRRSHTAGATPGTMIYDSMMIFDEFM
eukprot:Skav229741  [mRNA]  locus=scaffold1287:294205:299158:+ [translate_table: standard]